MDDIHAPVEAREAHELVDLLGALERHGSGAGWDGIIDVAMYREKAGRPSI